MITSTTGTMTTTTRTSTTFGWYLLLLLVLLLISNHPVLAGKDKEMINTNLPTVAPFQSFVPTKAPALKGGPPNDNNKNTLSPTAAPSPTVAAAAPTQEEDNDKVAAVKLPEMMFVMGKINSDDIQSNNMQDMFETFFTEKLFSTGTYQNAFLYTNMTSDSVQDASRILIQIIGEAVYNPRIPVNKRQLLSYLREEKETTNKNKTYAPVPTEIELFNIIQAYFSFWGQQNLQTYLINMKFPITDVRQVILNGVTVEETNKKDTSSVKSPVDDNDNTSSTTPMNYKMVAGIVTGGVVLMAAVLSALFIRHRRKQQQQLTRPTKNSNKDAPNYNQVDSGSFADDDIYSINNNNIPDILKDTDPSATTIPATPSPDKTLGIDSDSDGGNSPVYPIPSFSQPPEPQSPVSLPPPPPPPLPSTFDNIQESQDNDDDDDDDLVSESCASDADIVSVTESLLYFENNKQKGPLFGSKNNENSTNIDPTPNETSPSTPPTVAMKPIAMSGKTSVRTPSTKSNFKYDANRLDEVITNAQGLQQQKQQE